MISLACKDLSSQKEQHSDGTSYSFARRAHNKTCTRNMLIRGLVQGSYVIGAVTSVASYYACVQ